MGTNFLALIVSFCELESVLAEIGSESPGVLRVVLYMEIQG